MARRLFITVLVLAGVSGCGPTYSPDTYASNAAQQANKVEQGVIAGVRNVGVSAAGTVGTVTGAAAGGIAGSQAIAGPTSAFTALGGALVGGIAGSTIEHATADTTAFEYIVRKPNGDLVSVTQKDKTPLTLGQKVLVIGGNQARVVADYTVPPSVKAAEAAKAVAEPVKPDPNTPDAKPAEPTETAAQPADAKAPASLTPAAVVSPGAAGSVGAGVTGPGSTGMIPAALVAEDKPAAPAKSGDN